MKERKTKEEVLIGRKKRRGERVDSGIDVIKVSLNSLNVFQHLSKKMHLHQTQMSTVFPGNTIQN